MKSLPACLLVLISFVTLAAQEQQNDLRVLADFQREGDVKIAGSQAKGERTKLNNGSFAITATTSAEASYPGIEFRPAKGMWDLTGYDAVEVDVSNPSDAPLRVLLSINNPGADGRKHCNVEGINVPASGKATVSVPFGSWHGETNHPLDLTKIESLRVFLEQPKGSRTYGITRIRAVRFGESRFKELAARAEFAELRPFFGRGVNFGNALDAPNEGDWGVRLEERYFELIKKAGFDAVRLPVRWSAHAGKTAPYTIDAAFAERVDWALDQAEKHKLKIVLNVHHYDELIERPAEHYERYLTLWKQIAERYRNRPASVAFELLNEPHSNMTAEKWNALLAKTIAQIRQTNPERWLVVGGVGWNSIAELPSLKLPEHDRKIIATIHYYSPHHFTHQGASWSGPEAQKWLGTKWERTALEMQAVRNDFDRALAWSIENRRPLYLGEFGAYEKADLESRVRWTRFIAEEAAKRNMSTAYWEFCHGFGIYKPGEKKWVEPLKAALFPSVMKGSP